jgi:transposase
MLQTTDHLDRETAAAQSDPARYLVSLELSRSTWLGTTLAPDSEKLSRHQVEGGDAAGLLALLDRMRTKTERRLGRAVQIVTIQEVGLDGFWLHRRLERHGIESHIVEAASIAVPRRHRRAKTDRLDGEVLIRTLAAWLRGEPRVCSMVQPPSPEEEDRKRLTREREELIAERVRLVNRIKGLLFGQGIRDYQPLRRDRWQRLEALATGDGRPLPPQLEAELRRMLERVDLVCRQLEAVERDRDARTAAVEPTAALLQLKGIGPEIAARLWVEALYRSFANRRQVAAYAGLAPTPWQSGDNDREQGIAKSGNPRLRTTMVELAWLWLRYQPGSALSRWFRERVGDRRGRARMIAIVAVARKLLIALWRYVTQGLLPEGAEFKAA